MKEKMKEKMLRYIEVIFSDMESRSYNKYTDDSTRFLAVTVKELKWLYQEFGGDINNLPLL